jgi:hypothetical protein
MDSISTITFRQTLLKLPDFQSVALKLQQLLAKGDSSVEESPQYPRKITHRKNELRCAR